MASVEQRNIVVKLYLVAWLAVAVAFDAEAASPSAAATQQRLAAPSKPAAARQPGMVVLNSIALSDSSSSHSNPSISYSRRAQLSLNVSGTPVQFRAGENPQLQGARWQDYRRGQRLSYQFAADTEGTKTVYVQLRGISTDPSTYSAIRSDSIQYRKLPRIVGFRIDNGAASAAKREVGLSWSVAGIATHYRASESPNFAGANWISGATPPSGRLGFNLAQGASGTRTIYLELRRDNSPAVRSSDSIGISFGICPIGHRGLECSGAGTCNVNGSCDCNPDISGVACTAICQRCYGAAGNNCGVADGMNFPGNIGLCIKTSSGTKCQINAGSWAHDECCVRYRFGGPNNNQGSCTAPGLGPPPYVCQGDLAKAVAQLPNPLLTWTRTVDSNKSNCTDGIEMPVTHADMCNPSGGKLLCSDSKYCCSGQAKAAPVQPNIAVGGTLCICE